MMRIKEYCTGMFSLFLLLIWFTGSKHSSGSDNSSLSIRKQEDED